MNKTLKVATVYASSYGRIRLVRGETILPGALDPNKVKVETLPCQGKVQRSEVYLEQAKLHEVELELSLSYPLLDTFRSVYNRAEIGAYSLLTVEKLSALRMAWKEYNVLYSEAYDLVDFLDKAEMLLGQPSTVVIYWE